MEFIQESWPQLLVGLLIVIALVFIVRIGRKRKRIRPLSKLNPLKWLSTIRQFYLSKLVLRQWTINILGAAFILWFASFYINWIQPALTPADLFPPEFTGPVAVKAWKVDRGPVVNMATYTGRIEAYQSNDVYARVDGFVEKMHVYEGDYVKKGQVLAQLDLSNARPQLVKALADSTFLYAELKRSIQLHQDGIITPSEFDRVNKMYQQAAAQVQLMRAKVGYATIRAGIHGHVSERHIYSGQYIKKGQKIFRVDQLDKVRIKFAVSEEDLPFIKRGDPVLIEFPQFSTTVFEFYKEWRNQIHFLSENDQTNIWVKSNLPKYAGNNNNHIERIMDPDVLPGMLVENTVVYPAEDPMTRTGTIEVRLSNPGYLLKSNGYAVGKFAVARVNNTIRIPTKAILDTPEGKTVVYIAPSLTEQGFAEEREVTIGLMSPIYTQVLTGVEAGEYVVYVGMKNLAQQQSILVLDRRD